MLIPNHSTPKSNSSEPTSEILIIPLFSYSDYTTYSPNPHIIYMTPLFKLSIRNEYFAQKKTRGVK